jgi:Spy/CpxP family protein refolding chaperone
LELTDDQKAKVKEITEASRTNIQPLAQQLRDGHQKLEALGTDGSFDQAKVEALAAEQSALMGKMIVEKERTKAQIFAILTDEQKAKAAELKKNRPERGKGHKGFGGGFGRGFGGPAGSDAQ